MTLPVTLPVVLFGSPCLVTVAEGPAFAVTNTAVAAMDWAVGSASAVSALRLLFSVCPNWRRAAAASTQDAGDSTGRSEPEPPNIAAAIAPMTLAATLNGVAASA